MQQNLYKVANWYFATYRVLANMSVMLAHACL